MLRFLLPFLCFSFIGIAKLPEITPRDVRSQIEEMLQAHVCHKKLTPALISRSFENFLDELDPSKTYLIEKEVTPWLFPTEEMLAKTLSDFLRGDFSTYEELYETFLFSIERRNLLEKKITSQELPQEVSSEELQIASWAKTEEELFSKLLKIRALQGNMAQKLGSEDQGKFFQLIEKRRLSKEAGWAGTEWIEKQKMLLTTVLKSLATSLDAHTHYFTPSEAGQFMIQVQQRLFGIGVQLRDDLDGLSVVRVLENSPASLDNKLKANDKILAVNKEPIFGMDITEVVEWIRGEEGTSVFLTVLREKETLEIELVRKAIVLEESRLETSLEPFGDGAIVVLKLFSFYQDPDSSSSLDMRKALQEIQNETSIKGIILDLRNNSGGLLTQAVAVTGLFIQNGIVASVKDHQGRLQHLRETEGNPVWKGPLFVLVNRSSASAAEIVAQTLQDYGRALVVGDSHTFGKGSFQTFSLDASSLPKVNPKGEYKVTRGKYYTVSGKSPQLQGVSSNISIPGILQSLDIGEKFSKFPLENDSIDPNFDDDLADLSPFHRMKVGAAYRANLQPKLFTYTPYLERLVKNSEERQQRHKHYQNFLIDASQKQLDSPATELFIQTDLQLGEAMNAMKDLLYLMPHSLD